MTSRCFMPFPARFDVRSAEKDFGPIVYMYVGRVPYIRQSQRIYDEYLQKLDEESFDPANDYVIIAGHSVFVSLLVAAILAEYGSIQILIFDPAKEKYFAQNIHATDETRGVLETVEKEDA